MAPDIEPLSVLVSRCLVPLIWELDDGSDDVSLPVWADLLRILPEAGASPKTLTSLAHVSQRSMSVLASGAERVGVATLDSKTKELRPTKLGRHACMRWDKRVSKVETAWDSKTLRNALTTLVGTTDVELPWLLLPYGPSDDRAAIGPAVQRTSDAHGLPLFALLSQLLAALTMRYEAKHGWMLMMMVGAIGEIPDEGLPLTEVPAVARIMGNGKSVHERHGIVVVESDEDGRKIAYLTPGGRRLRDTHRPILDAVEREWAEAVGVEKLRAVRRELSKLATSLPTKHVRHLQMKYVKGGRAYIEANERG